MHSSFYDEFTKLGAAPKGKKPRGYTASILAHELGHAQDFETRRAPNLRKAVEQGVWLGGTTGAIIGAMQGKPGVAAIARGASQVPHLIDEATASYKAIKSLDRTKGFTPAEVTKMKRHLIAAGGTYLGQAAVQTGMAAGAAQAVRYGGDPVLAVPVGQLASIAVGYPLGKIFERSGKRTPVITEAQGAKLKRRMKVQAKIFKGKPNLPGVAAYVHKYPGRLTKEMRLQIIGSMLPGKEKDRRRQAQQMLREGGIITSPRALRRKRDIERRWPGMRKAAAEEKPSLVKRVGKGLGLGAVTLGVGGGIAALAAGKKGRQSAYRFVRRKLGKTKTKTSAVPWSTLGTAVAR